jgi:V8-like Glu-specific endopeptidase
VFAAVAVAARNTSHARPDPAANTLCKRKPTMATSTAKKPAKINLHASVSNETEEAASTTKKSVSRPPSEGHDGKGLKPAANGCEAVTGFKLMAAETAEAAAAAVGSKAPDTSKLRDIGEASFGAPGAMVESVIERDDRVRIANTSVYPWRATASLLITAADNSQWIGTGWFISPRTLVTAGHCVFIKGSGVPGRDGWVKRIVVMPGRNGSSLPYGSVTATSFRSVTGWTANGNHEFDYGVIILPTPLGNSTGWFGFGNYTDADLLASVGNITGYPGDKPTGTMWYDARRIASVSSRKVHYAIDTAGGQSGAAVYRVVNGNRFAFGIHAYGGTTTNSGTRINAQVFANLNAWKV